MTKNQRLGQKFYTAYFNNGITIRELAQAYKVTPTYIRRMMLEYMGTRREKAEK